MDRSNSNKNISGINTKDVLNKSLEELKSTDSLNKLFNFKTNVQIGYKDKDPNQFKADAKISFDNNDDAKEIWFIKTSSSYRSDRIKGNEFDMEHIKQIYQNYKVKCFFVMPYSASIKERSDLNELNKVITQQSKLTYFNGAYIISEFLNKLLIRCVKGKSAGKQANILGEQAEKWVINAFDNKHNIAIWNNYIKNSPDNKVKSSNYPTFQSILNSKHINEKIEDVSLIKCGSINKNSKHYSSQLSHLKTGGKPKTDVYIQLELIDKIIYLKVSVKFPNNMATATTVHQGNVDDTIHDLINTKDLNPQLYQMLPNLQKSLNDFQNNGTIKGMRYNYNKNFLADNLSRFNEWFIKYFIFGINNSKLNELQIANVVTIFSPIDATVRTLNEEDVLSDLMLKVKNKTATVNNPFGKSPFRWTYQGKRGTNFQVKAKLH